MVGPQFLGQVHSGVQATGQDTAGEAAKTSVAGTVTHDGECQSAQVGVGCGYNGYSALEERP